MRRSGRERGPLTGRAAAAAGAGVAAAVLSAVCFQMVATAVFGTCPVVPALLSGSSVAVQLPFSTP